MSSLLVLGIISSFVAAIVYGWVATFYPVLSPAAGRTLLCVGTLLAGVYALAVISLLAWQIVGLHYMLVG